MKNAFKVTWKRISIMMIVLLAAGAIFCIYKYSDHISSVTKYAAGEQSEASESISENGVTIQEFIPQHEYLEAIGLKLYGSNVTAPEGGLYLTVLSQDSCEIASASTLISMMPVDGYYYFQLNLTVVPGQSYYIMLYADNIGEESIQLACYDTNICTFDTNGFYTAGGERVEEKH